MHNDDVITLNASIQVNLYSEFGIVGMNEREDNPIRKSHKNVQHICLHLCAFQFKSHENDDAVASMCNKPESVEFNASIESKKNRMFFFIFIIIILLVNV